MMVSYLPHSWAQLWEHSYHCNTPQSTNPGNCCKSQQRYHHHHPQRLRLRLPKTPTVHTTPPSRPLPARSWSAPAIKSYHKSCTPQPHRPQDSHNHSTSPPSPGERYSSLRNPVSHRPPAPHTIRPGRDPPGGGSEAESRPRTGCSRWAETGAHRNGRWWHRGSGRNCSCSPGGGSSRDRRRSGKTESRRQRQRWQRDRTGQRRLHRECS
mmetsp:Transcript_29061/g.41105  ORF Transcript_29061/g.41105 Transcript_29061/m.41105 type:complete len:210 (-) Transcript_29061:736-1365(-)